MNENVKTYHYHYLQITTVGAMDAFIYWMKSCDGFSCGSGIDVQSSAGQNHLAVCGAQAGATVTQAICCSPPYLPPSPNPPPLPPWPPGFLFPPSPPPSPPTPPPPSPPHPPRPPPNPSPPPPPPPVGYTAIYVNSDAVTCEVQGACFTPPILSSPSLASLQLAGPGASTYRAALSSRSISLLLPHPRPSTPQSPPQAWTASSTVPPPAVASPVALSLASSPPPGINSRAAVPRE